MCGGLYDTTGTIRACHYRERRGAGEGRKEEGMKGNEGRGCHLVAQGVVIRAEIGA